MPVTDQRRCLYREQRPARRCSDCYAWLSTGNDTDRCWSCGGTWSPLDDRPLPKAMREAVGEAFDRAIAPGVLL